MTDDWAKERAAEGECLSNSAVMDERHTVLFIVGCRLGATHEGEHEGLLRLQGRGCPASASAYYYWGPHGQQTWVLAASPVSGVSVDATTTPSSA